MMKEEESSWHNSDVFKHGVITDMHAIIERKENYYLFIYSKIYFEKKEINKS